MTLSTFAEFESRVGAVFSIELGTGPIPITLKEAKPLGHGVREGGAFSLVFEGDADTSLPQSIYQLEGDGETLELFLVPIGPFGEGMGYEAVFT